MSKNKDCSTCQSCEDILKNLDRKLISIADALLYNTRFGLNRPVDRNLFRLLVFYKEVLTAECSDTSCGCFTVETPSCVQEIPNTGNPDAVINHCICGCCPPLNPVCNFNPGTGSNNKSTTALTKENIEERIKILIA